MLTYIQINAAKPRDKEYALSDSQGLHLAIRPNGSKLWRFKYRFLDKQKTLHLGGWPTISLADARVRRDEAKKLVANGRRSVPASLPNMPRPTPSRRWPRNGLSNASATASRR